MRPSIDIVCHRKISNTVPNSGEGLISSEKWKLEWWKSTFHHNWLALKHGHMQTKINSVLGFCTSTKNCLSSSTSKVYIIMDKDFKCFWSLCQQPLWSMLQRIDICSFLYFQELSYILIISFKVPFIESLAILSCDERNIFW